MNEIPNEFEFQDLNKVHWKVYRASDKDDYWLWSKHPDGGWISRRKVNTAAFENELSELEKFYEKSKELLNYREGYN